MGDLQDRSVLIVEDEYYLAKDVQQTLKRAGARIVGPFPREEDALAAMAAEQPDCAIIDINTGAGASFTLADTLRERGVPFLFFTGYDREMIPQRFSDVTRLQKPVDTARLVAAAKSICDKAGCPPST